jgi:hypothetical protein
MAAPDTNTTTVGSGGDASQRNGVMSRVRESASAQLSNQKNKATEGLGSVAQAVRQSTQQLREQQHDTLAGYVESAADQIERLSQRLRSKEVSELLNDVQNLARRQPAAVIGGAFLLGLLGVRFLKSSSRSNEQYYRGRDDRWSTRGGEYGAPSGVSGGGFGSAGYAGGGTSGTSGWTERPGTTGGYTAGASGTAHVSTTDPMASGTAGIGSTDAENTGERTSGQGGKGARGSRGSGKTERS